MKSKSFFSPIDTALLDFSSSSFSTSIHDGAFQTSETGEISPSLNANSVSIQEAG